jgi:glycosyltransferase involved in cell wall biosynthesis
VPTYKRSKYLKRALDSILGQTYTNLEIVLIDDNPPEDEEAALTAKVVESYRQDARIVYLKTSGSIGGGAARNLGLKHCGGAYIAFLDDDDRYLPDKIETQLKFMLENDLDMSYQDVQWFDENEQVLEYRRHDRVTDFSREGLMRVHLQVPIAPTSIYMVRSAALHGVKGFGEVPRGQDFYFMLSCIEAGLKIRYMPGAHVVQYVHRNERISVGPKFVQNATEEYLDKKRLAQGLLTKKEMRFMDFRFQCVCAFASLRGGQKWKAAPYAMRAALLSPANCVKEAVRYFKRS